KFARLLVECLVSRGRGSSRVDAVLPHLHAVANRLTDLRTSAMKLAWLLQRRDADELDPMMWMFFASGDVTFFFTTVRSLFDHLAQAITAAAPQPGGVPRSFNDLRNWASRQDIDAGRQIGDAVVELVLACDWFDTLRSVRDALVHRDAQTIVFPTAPGIAFQVYGAARLL